MNYNWSESDIYYLESLGINVEEFDRACYELAKATQSMAQELMNYFRGIAEICIKAFKELVDNCDVFTESLDIEFRTNQRYKPVMSLGNYENPKLTYRYLHKDRFRERR